MSSGLEIRRAQLADDPAILDLLGESLGWARDADHDAFFHWKHRANPFGSSPAWVATDGDRIVGVRMLLRWEFRRGDDRSIRAVRAVDTATHPDAQGRGVFTQLTTTAVEELRDEGICFVFNTPNHRSAPGYLKMGWHEVGPVPTAVRPGRLGALAPLVRGRTAADKWGIATGEFPTAAEVFASERLPRLVDALERGDRLHTDRTAEYLRWRYGFAPLQYEFAGISDELDDGGLVLRVRRRGALRELAVVEVLVPPGSRPQTRRLVGAAIRSSGADHAIGVGLGFTHGFCPIPRLGPLLTSRVLADPMPKRSDDFTWGLGDIELF